MPAVDRNNPKRAASSDSRYTVMEFMQDFPDDATCLEWLWRMRFSEDGTHAFCDKCQTERAFARYATAQRRQSWTCKSCGNHLHPTAGTIFHKSATALHLWFYAMYLMTSTRCGISAKQLERELGVTYKTAWRMYNLIRGELMTQDETPLVGEVEADETYVGGRPRLKDRPRKADGTLRRGPRTGADRKIPVFGAVERGGKVRATVVPNTTAETISTRVEEFILPESVLFTDEYAVYTKVGAKFAEHHRVNHSAKVYVSGNAHTQTIEGFWSLLKRGISGTYHAVSAKHLQGYLNEYAWRYNHRDALDESGPAMFALLLHRAVTTTV
jgi:transposase-like protein